MISHKSPNNTVRFGVIILILGMIKLRHGDIPSKSWNWDLLLCS